MLYTFYLILHLLSTQHCALWVGSIPTSADVDAACGQIDFAQYEIVVQDLVSGAEVCRPDDIYTLSGCQLSKPMDEYRIVVMKPAREVLACAVTLDHDGQPTRADLAAACPPWALAEFDAGRGEIQFVKSEQIPQPAPLCPRVEIPSGPGMYDQPASAAELATDEPLTLLAGRLIWFGIVAPNCDGLSGISDTVTLSADGCGLKSARQAVTRWQNRFDEDIYQAALAEGVPARLLKAILLAESQSWTMPGPGADGEIGPYQVTDPGLDTLLRYTDPRYGGMPLESQFQARAAVRDALRCEFCTLAQADAHTRANMRIYARLLASYRCQVNGDWHAAAVAWNEIYSEKLQ